MSLNNRQLRALKLAQQDGAVSETQWSVYGYSKAYVDDLTVDGYLRRDARNVYRLTGKGEKALAKR